LCRSTWLFSWFYTAFFFDGVLKHFGRGLISVVDTYAESIENLFTQTLTFWYGVDINKRVRRSAP